MTAETRQTLKEAVDRAVRDRLRRCDECGAVVVTEKPIGLHVHCSRTCESVARDRRQGTQITLDLSSQPADPELFQAACDARFAFDSGELSEDAYLSTMAAYQRTERERFERVMRAAFAA